MTKSRDTLIAGVLIAVSLAFTTAIPFLHNPLGGQGYYGQDIYRKAPSFQMQDAANHTIDIGKYKGKFVYLMFGYLACESVCHTQALIFNALSRQLKSEKVQFLYLGMNPAEDTPERVSAYFDSRAPNFTGLVAKSMRQAQAIAADYHAYFYVDPKGDEQTTTINHPGFIYLIDPQGYLRLVYMGNYLDLQSMLADLNQLANEFS